jgi:DME family drug/metabolite transporter
MDRDRRGYLLVLLAAALWSTSGAFIRWILAGSGFSALSLAFWRDLTTFACLLAGLAGLRREWLHVERRDLPWLAALGAISVGAFHVLWNMAVVQIGYAVATILLYSAPVFVAIVARLVWREPLTRYKVLAIVMALAGCVLVAGPERLKAVELTAGGLVLGLVTALAYSSFSLFGRPLARRYSPWTVLTYGFGFGALVLLPFQFAAGLPRPVPATTWLWFAALVGLATILPFGAYLASLRRLPVSVASIMAASEVAFGTFLAYVLFGEQLQGWQFLGAALVVAGVILISSR